ncbi:ABC transporter substrate-binding protein [Natrononativus amylolyticus]|uniref:ABC transporter substrate-binding protein n=1 Tax=Natrononativus amylolyticus TaxID=2963434 RepID=UPI0020CEAA46|nr:ABC transporter substrate-binding protein [Natrononativus amylolyticus]
MARKQFDITRRNLLASGAAVSAAAIAGCIGGENGETDDGADDADPGGNGDSAVFHFTQEQSRAEDFDPVIANDAYSAQVYGLVFDGLYEWGEGLELEPKVATGEPDVEDDGRRFMFEIHEGIEFHNGDELTASDVAHSFLAPVEEETENAASYDMIESAEPIDDYQLEVNLEEPYGPFELQTMAVTISPEEARTDDRDAFNTDPIGSGPYTFEDFSENEYVELERWDDYWDDEMEEPNIESVTFVAHDDDAGRISDIRAGETDAIAGIPNDDWDVLEGEDNVEVHRAESPSYMYLAFNCNEGGTTDPDVRRAIAHSFDMESFVNEHAEHTADPMTNPIPPTVNEVWGFPEDEYGEMLPEYDPEEAEALLDESDAVDDDWEPIIITPEGIRASLAERIATRLGEIGYGAEVNVLDFGQLVETYNTGDADDYEMYLLGWTGGPDPDFYLYSLFHESQAGVNQGHFYEGSDGFHDAIAEGRTTADQDERYEIYEPVIEEIVEELPALAAFTQHNTMASGDHVEGLEVHPNVQTNPNLISYHTNVSLQ